VVHLSNTQAGAHFLHREMMLSPGEISSKSAPGRDSRFEKFYATSWNAYRKLFILKA
jgi:hypothetical protein